MLRLLTVVLLVGLLSVGQALPTSGGSECRADEETVALANLLPRGYNTISVLRLKQMRTSPKGDREGWSARLEQELSAGTGDLPPWLETLVVGSLTHPNVPEEVWAAGVMRRPEDVSLTSLAEHFDSSVTELAGRPVIQTNRGSFLVEFPGNLLGAYRPAQRQQVARWIRDVEQKSTAQTDAYLQQALETPGDLILALHVEDMLDPAHVERRLREDDRFRNQSALIAQLVPLLSGLRGVTLAATVQERIDCRISIDFSQPVGPSSAIVKTLFLALLEDAGAMIEEFPGARISTSGNSVLLTCELSDESLRRLISLIVPPRTPHSFALPFEQTASTDSAGSPRATAPAAETPEEIQARTARANRRYLDGANRIINDLYRASRNASDYRRTITWHETFARKLEALPTDSVREEFVDFSLQTAQRFRALASSLRGQGIRVDTKNRAITREVTSFDPGWTYVNYWGGFGYRPPVMHVESNVGRIREQQAAAVAEGQLEREKIWAHIREDQARMQRLLSE